VRRVPEAWAKTFDFHYAFEGISTGIEAALVREAPPSIRRTLQESAEVDRSMFEE